MKTEASIEIDAPVETVWAVYTDVERWPDWTESVTRLSAIDGARLEIGGTFEIVQPRMPTLRWTITEFEAGRSWTWVQRSVGATTVASHLVEPVARDPSRTVVRQVLVQRGLLGSLVGLLMRRLTRTYLDMESKGLKAASEARRNDAAS